MGREEHQSMREGKEAWEILAECRVRYDPSANSAKDHEILVGLGESGAATSAGIVLNNKNPAGRSQVLRSVSELVSTASDVEIRSWKSKILNAGRLDIVVEDLSLDTCFSMFLLGRRLKSTSGYSSSKLVNWLKYVNAWESGYYVDTCGHRKSIAMLHASLAHSHLRANRSLNRSEAQASCGPDLTRGFRQCLELLSAAYEKFNDPYEQISLPGLDVFEEAQSQLLFESQQYLKTLSQALKCQLELPLKRSNERVIVDALMFTEDEPSAVTKIFARTDSENSWSGNGFTLLAIHRPSFAGTGNDITISVSPSSGTTLRDLWVELENEEDVRWTQSREERPAQKYRELESYNQLSLTNSLNRPNGRHPEQPWWDDLGRHTILAAPKSVGGLAGSKLDWIAVRKLIWKTYGQVPPRQIKPRPLISDPKVDQLIKAGWVANVRRDVADTDTLGAWLAYVSMHKPSGGSDEPLPEELPTKDQFDVVQIPGGRVYVHSKGATVFDDWTPTSLDIESVKKLLCLMHGLKDGYTRLTGSDQHQKIVDLQAQMVEGGALDAYAQADWDELILEAKRTRAELVTKYLKLDTPSELEELRSVVERRWSITEGRRRADLLITRLDQDTQTNLAAHKQRREKWLSAGAAGLAFALLVNQGLKVAQDRFTMNLHEWGLEMSRSNLTTAQIIRLQEAAQESEKWEAYVFYGSVGGLAMGIAFAIWPSLRSGLRRRARRALNSVRSKISSRRGVP